MSATSTRVAGIFDELLANPVITQAVPAATGETIYMVLLALVVSIIFGVPLGVYLWNSGPTGLRPSAGANQVVGTIVNVVRSLPFVILMVLLLPVTRFVVGTTLGATASVVPLAIGAIPFLARLVESALREVSAGKIEASIVCGATDSQTIVKTLLPRGAAQHRLGRHHDGDHPRRLLGDGRPGRRRRTRLSRRRLRVQAV